MKRHAPATGRNADAIADVLARELPETGRVLEIASGSGEHAVHFARKFPALEWMPSDPDPDAIQSIDAWTTESGLTNIAPPVFLDAGVDDWPVDRAAAIFCCNMVHISPWKAAQGLFRGAALLLGQEAPLILYGPFLEDNVETAPSNLAFDQNLKMRNPDWGIRAIEVIDTLAKNYRLVRTSRTEMPANNLTLTYRKV